ncbi:MAG: ribosome biogenesis factor YjgA [Thioalkalispiraceae bacterium]|jgi:ribosome-associated protein
MPDHDELIPKKSKAQQKRDAEAAQALGAELVKLTVTQLDTLFDKLELPDALHEALLLCRSIKAREGHRRQLQYIGKLMRDIDPVPIQQLLAQFKRGGQVATAQLHLIEGWRDRLLSDEEGVLDELVQQYPETDASQVRKLIASARKESVHNQPPRAARLLFKYLRALLED